MIDVRGFLYPYLIEQPLKRAEGQVRARPALFSEPAGPENEIPDSRGTSKTIFPFRGFPDGIHTPGAGLLSS